MKKLISLLLALCMLFALAACGAGDDAADDAAADDAAADDAAADDAAADSGETYTITWYYGGTAQADINMVQEELAKYINETYGLNIALNMVAVPYGDLGQKMNMVLTSGEDWDLCFTSSWANSFGDLKGNGAFLPLEDLIAEYAPGLDEVVGNYWSSVTSDGHIWAVPNIQLEYKWAFTSVPTQWVEMYNAANPETPLAQENMTTYAESMNDFFYWCKENVVDAGATLNGVAPSYVSFGSWNAEGGYPYLMEDIGTSKTYFTLGDETNTIKTVFDYEQYIENSYIGLNWYNDGIVQSDMLTRDSVNSDLATLNWMAYAHPTFKPGEDANQYNYWGLNQDADELTFFTFGERWANTSAVISTLTAVNVNCRNPELVMQFLEIINTDATAFNMLCFGIEGYHYDVVDGCAVSSEENVGYNPNNDWGFGCQFLAYPRPGQSADIWEVTEEMNASANVSCAMGWMADTTNVQTQVANVAAVVEQYDKVFGAGALSGDADAWAAYIEEYKTAYYAAGAQDIVDELQSQVDAWMAANEG